MIMAMSNFCINSRWQKSLTHLKAAKELLNIIGNYTDFIINTLIYMSHCELECKMTLSSSRSLKDALDALNASI